MTTPIAYTLFNPTGNMTLLAETPVAEASQPLIARKLMALEPETEQVGFVTKSDDGITLRMAGGEFCGNASMCAAVLFMERSGRGGGTVRVRVSGTPEPVSVTVEAMPDGSWSGCVTMPRPISTGKICFPGQRLLPVVRFPGIAHVILEEKPERSRAEQLAREWCRYLDAEALGLMFLNRERGSLTPLVYVPSAETLFWESSCASGTTAVGAYLTAESGGPVCMALSQPGGMLEIRTGEDGSLFLKGSVRPVKSGYANPRTDPEDL